MNLKRPALRILGLFSILLLLSGDIKAASQSCITAQRKPGYTWRQTDSSLALLNHGRVVWQLNYKKQGKPYFHPVSLVDGTKLTWVSPPDHPWHYGLWFSWKYINGLNYWEEDRKTGLSQGRTELVNIKVEPNRDCSAQIEMTISYHPPGKPTLQIEKRQIIVSTPDENGIYHIDWQSTFAAGIYDVVLDRTPIPGEKDGKGWGGYAGLSVRLAKSITEWQVLDSEGRKGMQAHGKKARWMDFSGITPTGKSAGIAIFDHPHNLRHPSPWFVIMNPEVPFGYFSPAVLFNKPYTLPATKSMTLRYRILIHPGRCNSNLLDKEWKRFSALREKPAVGGFEKFGPALEKTRQLHQRIESAKMLEKLCTALLSYGPEAVVKFPDSLQELLKHVEVEQNISRWWLENVQYLGKGKTDAEPPDTVLAYDKQLLAKGKGTNVLFLDGYVGFERPSRLEQLGIIKPAITIESRFFVVPAGAKTVKDFLEKEGLPLVPTRTRPVRSHYLLDDRQVKQFRKLTQTLADSKMLTAPRVTVFDGEQASISEEEKVDYISGYTEPRQSSGQPQPKHDAVAEGIQLKVTPKLQADNKSILLKLDVQLSELVGFQELLFKQKYPYQIPEIQVVNINTQVLVPAGQTLLIAGATAKSIGTAEQRPAPGQKPKELIIMIKTNPAELSVDKKSRPCSE